MYDLDFLEHPTVTRALLTGYGYGEGEYADEYLADENDWIDFAKDGGADFVKWVLKERGDVTIVDLDFFVSDDVQDECSKPESNKLVIDRETISYIASEYMDEFIDWALTMDSTVLERYWFRNS